MRYSFADLVDVQSLQKLMLSFYEMTGIPYALVDISGSILGKIGWLEICECFHRACPQSEKNCKESDSYISRHLHERSFVGYQCLNGLMDYATPIIVEGQHLATLFTGQFLHTPPDENFFRSQARKYGFNETAYLEALRLVPVIPRERAESIMLFFSQLAQFLALLGLERKRQLRDADKILKDREQRLKLVFEETNDGFWDWDIETGEVYYSPNWLKMSGYSPEEMNPHIYAWKKLLHPDEAPDVLNLLSGHLAGKTREFKCEYRLLTGTGEWKWVLSRGKVVARNEQGSPLRMAGTIIDITERKQVEEALEKERLRLFTLLEKLPASVCLIAPDYSIVFANNIVRSDLGEVKGSYCYKVFHGREEPCEDCIVPEMLAANTSKETERTMANGNIHHNYYSPFYDIDGSLLVISVAFEVTQQKRLEKEMARLERMNLVGEMAAGIGHEIRNPMTTVRGLLQMLEEKDDCARYRDYFKLMIEELDRANTIISEYLSLAKNKPVELKRKSLNRIISVILPLITADALVTDKHIEVEMANIPMLLLDEKEIRQLILNLVRNGLEAMSPGGFVLIKTYADNENVVLAVRDHGNGISQEILEKIGTPFYTTKENGTGLGLAVCYSIAARHNATIDLETGQGGTTFYVRFKTKNKAYINKITMQTQLR